MTKNKYLRAFASMLFSVKPFAVGIGLIIYLCIIIRLFGINFPYADQWEAVLFFQKFKNNALTFNDLLAQHNEHRIFFPKLIMLLEANLSHWNIFFELFTNIFLGTCIYVVIAKNLLKITIDKYLIGIISLLILSAAQYENWMWGWQIQIFLNILMVCLGLTFLTKSQDSTLNFIIAIAAGIIATFSFANGVLYWFVGIILLFQQKRSAVMIISWGLISVLMLWFYLHNYHRPPEHPVPQLTLSYFINYVAFVFAYLGNPIFESDANASLIFGIMGVVIYFYTWSRIIFQKNIQRNSYEVFIYLSFYAILSAFVTGFGRTGLGLSIAATSRYVTISNLFWIANFIGIYLFLKTNSEKNIPQQRFFRGVSTILFLAILTSHIVGTTKIIEHKRLMNAVKTTILSGNFDPETLKQSYPKPQIIIERDKILKENHWSYRTEWVNK